jgi:HD-GYP domain-containing protein (c-di-GMP phosphodiesterase class II)
MACDHSASHSGVTQYRPDTATLRLALVCDACGAEQTELGHLDYWPKSRHYSAQLAELTARALDFDEPHVRRIGFATLMCDVGRDQIPAEILYKRGPLTPDEQEIIRRQPELGAQQLSDPRFDDIREWILTRRERPDGLGYPFGLAGGEIPVQARILSVVDAFVAMISDRPHRPARHQAFALRELLDNAGRQFDVTVVTAFVRARPRQHNPLRLAA